MQLFQQELFKKNGETIMALNSVHTNVSAIIALQGLNRTNQALDASQKRVNTGFKIADAKDDGAGFSIAQGLRSDLQAYEAVQEQLSKGRGTLTVASEASRQISDTLADVRAVVTKLADENVSGDQRQQYQTDYDALRQEVTNFIAQADFNGINLLDGSAAPGLNIIGNIDGSTITLNAYDLATDISASLIDLDVPGTFATSALAAAAAQGTIDPTGTAEFVTAEANIGNTMAGLGANLRTLDNRLTYLAVLEDATTDGLGSIVDADLAKESAKLQSLQIRQQLGTQTLSIANSSPQILLSLFQG